MGSNYRFKERPPLRMPKTARHNEIIREHKKTPNGAFDALNNGVRIPSHELMG